MTKEKTLPEGAEDWRLKQEAESLRVELEQTVQVTTELESELSKGLIEAAFHTIGLREVNKLSPEMATSEGLSRLERVRQMLNAGIRESGTLASPKKVMQIYRQQLSSEDTILVLEGMLVADMVMRRGQRGASVLRSIAKLENKPLEEITTKYVDLIADIREQLSSTYKLEESIDYTTPIDRGMTDLGLRWDNKEKTYVGLKDED